MSATATSSSAATPMADAGTGASAASRRRRPDPWKTSFFVVAVVALAGGVAWALLGSSFFVVRSVHVIGAGTISGRQVIAAAGVKIGTPLIRVNTAQVARRVERITQIQSARVQRSWPDGVVISAVPRTPTFLVRDGRGYDVMDSYGVILGPATGPRAGLVLLVVPEAGPVAGLRGNAGVLAAGAVVRRLPAWLRHRVGVVRIRPGPRVVLVLNPRVTVIWGDATRAAAKAAEVAILLRTKATYFDVSDPGSVITGWPAGG